MKILIATVLALGIALPAAALPPGPIPAPMASTEPDPCAVSVRFGSYAMGIDLKALERVERYLAGHKRLVATSTVQRWGREGERTVCITTTSRRATSQVFADLKGLIRHRAERGPTEIGTADGRVWRASPKMPR